MLNLWIWLTPTWLLGMTAIGGVMIGLMTLDLTATLVGLSFAGIGWIKKKRFMKNLNKHLTTMCPLLMLLFLSLRELR